LELSGVIVPENVHPESEPLKLPFEPMVTVALVPSIRTPVQVPEIADSDAGVLELNEEAGSDVPLKVWVATQFSVNVPFRLEPAT
jgi:hypothetical protein